MNFKVNFFRFLLAKIIFLSSISCTSINSNSNRGVAQHGEATYENDISEEVCNSIANLNTKIDDTDDSVWTRSIDHFLKVGGCVKVIHLRTLKQFRGKPLFLITRMNTKVNSSFPESFIPGSRSHSNLSELIKSGNTLLFFGQRNDEINKGEVFWRTKDLNVLDPIEEVMGISSSIDAVLILRYYQPSEIIDHELFHVDEVLSGRIVSDQKLFKKIIDEVNESKVFKIRTDEEKSILDIKEIILIAEAARTFSIELPAMVPEYEELKKKRPELYSTISFFDFITPGKSPFLPHPVLRKVGKSNEIIDRVYQSDYKSGIFFIEKICEYLKKSFFGKDLNLALKYIYPKCFKE